MKRSYYLPINQEKEVANATKEKKQKKYASVAIKQVSNEAMKISKKFAEEAKKNWLWLMQQKTQKIYCQLCGKGKMNAFWRKKGMTLCLNCKKNLDFFAREEKAAS